MNLVRMMRNYGVQLDDDEFVAVLRHLSDTRGLSIEETDGFRYILENEPVANDHGPDQLMTDTCGRCHSYARVALQRRDGEDWLKLINFHLGQFPRWNTRRWPGIATGGDGADRRAGRADRTLCPGRSAAPGRGRPVR